MPSRERVEAFVAMVEHGQFVEALETFYADDATMQENNEPPRVGLAKLIENERRTIAAFPSATARHEGPVIVDGDQVVINWIFEFASSAGLTLRLDELTHQTWRGDRIVRERFYYDPRQMRPEW